MADIALTTANTVHVVESIEQATYPAGEAITAGMPVRLDADGKWTAANGTAAAEAAVRGVAIATVAAGMPVTAVKKGIMSGWDLAAMAYGADVFLSDTDGRLADAHGTVTVIAGYVVPLWSELVGSAPAKGIRIDL